jgi:hypothetical protein
MMCDHFIDVGAHQPLTACCSLGACSIVNLILACVLVPATASIALVTAYMSFRSLAAHKRWTQRRRRLFGMYALQVIAS